MRRIGFEFRLQLVSAYFPFHAAPAMLARVAL